MTRRTKDFHMPRKRTPNSLRQSAARLRRLAEYNDIGVADVDLNGNIIDAKLAILLAIITEKKWTEEDEVAGRSGRVDWERSVRPKVAPGCLVGRQGENKFLVCK